MTPTELDQILTCQRWAGLNAIGYSTARKLLRDGAGPKITQLSAGRFGIRASDNAAWQAARVRDRI